MTTDPAIQAVRDARHQISRSVEHDPYRLVEYYRKKQDKHRERLADRNEGGKSTQAEDVG
jgi:hypothetical protein